MSEHDIMVLKMMAGTMLCGAGLIICSFGAGLTHRSWGWWNL